MTALRDQLRQAVSVEQRCEAMFDLVGASDLDKDVKKRLWDLIDEAEEGKLPAAILTGVVLAMVPEGSEYRFWCLHEGALVTMMAMSDGAPMREVKAAHPECAIALALLNDVRITESPND